MTDARGKLQWAAEIGTYGDLRDVHGYRQACPFRWPGQYEDAETGLYYNRFRYYDPDAGGYVSQDPIGLAGGMALYAYVHDPLGWVDPFGLTDLDATGFSVYHIIDKQTNEVVYVGISNNPTAREGQHKASGRLDDGYKMKVQDKNLSYAQARGYEQADIAHYKTRDTSRIGQPMKAGEGNRVWSYDPSRMDDRAKAFKAHEADRLAARKGCK